MTEYRLIELSALSGVSVRNIRAYRERGLLDPPRKQGRSAIYDDRHLSQLRTVNELLRKGFTSAHIAEFLTSTREGHDLAGVLGLQQAAYRAPGGTDGVVVDVAPDGDEARRLVKYGLAEVVDDRLRLIDPSLAEIVGRVSDPLPYVRAILRVADRVADPLDDLAKEVADALEATAPAGECSPRREDCGELRRRVDDYRDLGRRVVADRFGDALRRHFVSAEATRAADDAPAGTCDAAQR
ncbi:MerR family transcriptional regulator [Mycolicibacterium sp. 050158]|uniref:MerR family transcriptional regulator n=1 Tax=Mycolicibacterium sp. 050158 TaxID=3090602 RepID=UPI00299DDEAE|nr:MerR family transcriptional regulator [Mycolicibacterium sp. 050158]MDX1891498.1 MerR family transcriptional regulator [Mycolicibacterium sp. 050158]